MAGDPDAPLSRSEQAVAKSSEVLLLGLESFRDVDSFVLLSPPLCLGIKKTIIILQ